MIRTPTLAFLPAPSALPSRGPAGLALDFSGSGVLTVGDRVIFETPDEYIEGVVDSLNTWFISIRVTGGTCTLSQVLVCDHEYQYLRQASP